MIPDLAWWARLAGLLALEAGAIFIAAKVASRWLRSPQSLRIVWQTALLAIALTWMGELAGLRLQARRLWPQQTRGPEWTVKVSNLPEEEVTPLPTAAAPNGPALVLHKYRAQSRVWWPGAVWLIGIMMLIARSVGSRFWVSMRGFGQPSGSPRLATSVIRAESGILDIDNWNATAAVNRLCRHLHVRGVHIVRLKRLCGPIAYGVCRPTIALPLDFEARFSSVQCEAMLAHELAHLAAHDPLWLAVADAVCALAWWHPLAWMARRELRAASEAAADSAGELAEGGRIALAESLVALGRQLTAEGICRGLGVGGSGTRSDLTRRVEALLGGVNPWKRVHRGWKWLGFGCGCVAALGAAVSPVPLASLSSPLGLIAQAARADVRAEKSGAATGSAENPGPAVREKAAEKRERSRLDDIIIPEADYRGATLASVVQDLNRLARENDPSKNGVRFAMQDPVPSEFKNLDPYGPRGWIGNVEIQFSHPLSHASLFDVLCAIAAGASQPIHVGTKHNEVAFTFYGDQPEPLSTRTYQVNRSVFAQFEAQTITRHRDSNLSWLHYFLSDRGAGISFTIPPGDSDARTVAYDDRTGLLFARATEAELGRIDRAVAPYLRTNAFRMAPENLTIAPWPPGPYNESDLEAISARGSLKLHQFRIDPAAFGPKITAIKALAELGAGGMAQAGLAVRRFFTACGLDTHEWDLLRVAGKGFELDETNAILWVRAAKNDFEVIDTFLKPYILAENSVDERSDAKRPQIKPYIQIRCYFVEIAEDASNDGEDIGLDWMLGVGRTNNSPAEIGPPTGELPGAQSPHASSIRVERYHVTNQWAIITRTQFVALKKRLEERSNLDFLTAPVVTTQSGRQARMSVQQVQSIVTGSAPEGPVSNRTERPTPYLSESVPFGTIVDLLPARDQDGWQIKIDARYDEFLGYLDPGNQKLPAKARGAVTVNMTTALPSIRSRETEALARCKDGDVVVLRGSIAENVSYTREGFFKRKGKHVKQTRFYVFVEPREVPVPDGPV